MSTSDRFSCYTFGEARTGIGQHIEFSCPTEPKSLREQIKEFIKNNIRNIDIPSTGRVNVSHGSYGRYTRYKIKQHKYAGGGCSGSGGYIEVLEVKNPPDGRWGIVINEFSNRKGSIFTEWETIKQACAVFSKYWTSSINVKETFPKLTGFKRRVVCGALTPWFYAIGEEQLIGDYTFPEGLQDDPVYRFGRKFVVSDDKNIPVIKTCMGTRFIENESHSRFIYWDDGSVSNGFTCTPRPVEENEMWVMEAVQQFRQLLDGRSTEFSINFTDSNKFVGKLVKSKPRTQCAEGKYFVKASLKGGKSKEGWLNFSPTAQALDVVQYVTQESAKNKIVVERIEIKESKVTKGGKKWAGVFFNSSF
ncbi:MAG: hypothetical protein KAR00_02860 [Candidatus Pacebacteria bacterium]|nr:hypothetical protein [Candidatus Paceibacterota bacterium]